MHHIKSVFPLVVLLFLSGCAKKEEPVLEDGTPVFRIIGLMDNKSLKLEAGTDDYYMKTDYNLNTNNVYRFEGDMKKICSNCNESFRIIIRNSAAGTGPVNPDSALGTGEYFYSYLGGSIPTSFIVNLDAQPKGSGAVAHLWNFGDGTISTLPNPTKVFKTGRDYNVSYTASYSSGCSSTLDFPIGLQPDFIPPIPINFFYNTDTIVGADFNFNATGDTTNASFTWNFGDGNGGDGNSISHTYTTPGEYKVTLTYITIQDTIIVAKNISALLSKGCTANFDFDKKPVLNPLNLATVEVQWTDADGVVYSSHNIPQNDPATSFIVTHASPYMINENGQKTRALDIVFTCTLTNGTKQIKLTNMSAHVAVAYP